MKEWLVIVSQYAIVAIDGIALLMFVPSRGRRSKNRFDGSQSNRAHRLHMPSDGPRRALHNGGKDETTR